MRLAVGIVRYGAVAAAIGKAMGVNPPPDCKIGHGRITLTFRSVGASHWPEAQQIENALQAAAIARQVLADDPRRTVRNRVRRAIVVVYEDSTLVRGCEVQSRWECVVTSSPRR